MRWDIRFKSRWRLSFFYVPPLWHLEYNALKIHQRSCRLSSTILQPLSSLSDKTELNKDILIEIRGLANTCLFFFLLFLENRFYSWNSSLRALLRHRSFLSAEFPHIPGKSYYQWTERCDNSVYIPPLSSRVWVSGHRHVTVQRGCNGINLHWKAK